MKFESFVSSALWALTLVVFVNCQAGRQPEVYYANLGQNIVLNCKVGGGQYACYSSYTYQNREYEMAYVNSSLKYQVNSGSIGINNVKATDAGFYACSSNCKTMRMDQVSYYLQPMSNGQQVDTSKQFIPIPRFPSNIPSDEIMYVVVTNEEDQTVRGGVLSGGEIAGLVIGLIAALLLTIAIIVLLCCLHRRKQQKREKILEVGQKGELNSVDYSNVEVDQDGNVIGEKKSLSNAKYDQDGNLINTKNLRGPNVRGGPDFTNVNPKDLPNVDINSHRGSQGRPGSNQGSYIGQPNQSGSYIGNNNQQSSRNPSYQGSYNGNNPYSNRQYQNQMEVPYEQNNQVPRPNRKVSESVGSQNGIDGVVIQPPPPKNGPVNNNKIQFPSRSNSSQQQFAPVDENPNLKGIVKDAGFAPPAGRNNRTPIQNQQPSNQDNPNIRQIVKDTGFNPPMGRNNRTPQQQQQQNNPENPNLQQIVHETDFNPPAIRNTPVQLPQYVSDDENINLHQIIKDSGFLADEILSPYGKEGDNPTSNPGSTRNPRQPTRQPEYDTEPTRQQPPKQKIPEFDQEPRQPQRQRQPAKQSSGDGGVTVVSARTPSTGGGSTQGFSVLPPTAQRSNNSLQQQQQQPPKYSLQPDQRSQKPLMPHLSYSQRIETTSTPMQVQQPSKSLRQQNSAAMNAGIRPAKEGSTDV